MEHQIIIKGTVCNLKPSQKDKPQEFGLKITAGKIKSTGEWAKNFFYTIVDWNNVVLENKQTVIVEGYFQAYLANDGTERYQIKAQKITLYDKNAKPQQAPQSFDDLPF